MVNTKSIRGRCLCAAHYFVESIQETATEPRLRVLIPSLRVYGDDLCEAGVFV